MSMSIIKSNLKKDVSDKIQECELCIVGAGLAGLNALAVAINYLGKNDRVIVVDRKNGIGGMWPEAYDYVRLHSPYRSFRCGNIQWKLEKPCSYLATKAEILDYLGDCYEQAKYSVRLDEYWNYSLLDCQEVKVNGDYEVHASFTSTVDQQAPPLIIKTQRLIKAFGFNLTSPTQLPLTSSSVKSITPSYLHLNSTEIQQSDKPIYIVGGGKSGMDVALCLANRFPDKVVHMLTGKGTAFLNRNKLFPKGIKRFIGGTLFMDLMLNVSIKFNGLNEDSIVNYILNNYIIGLDNNPQNLLFGFLSEEELAIISKNISIKYADYLEDVIDGDNSPVMVLKGGEKITIEEGSYFINCTGTILRKHNSYESYLSVNSRILSINTTSSIGFACHVSAYFLTHLWFLNKLKELPLIEFNYEALARKNRKLMYIVGMPHFLYNFMIISDVLPFKLTKDFTGFLDKAVYPSYRFLLSGLRLKINRDKYSNHWKKTLDTVRNKYDFNY